MELINNGGTDAGILKHLIETSKTSLHEKIGKIENHKGLWTVSLTEKMVVSECLWLANTFGEVFYYDDLGIEYDGSITEYVAGLNQNHLSLANILTRAVKL